MPASYSIVFLGYREEYVSVSVFFVQQPTVEIIITHLLFSSICNILCTLIFPWLEYVYLYIYFWNLQWQILIEFLLYPLPS